MQRLRLARDLRSLWEAPVETMCEYAMQEQGTAKDQCNANFVNERLEWEASRYVDITKEPWTI